MDVVAKAWWGVAQSYRAERRLDLALPALDRILADRAQVSADLFQRAQALLVQAHSSIAAGLAKDKNYDAAVAVLRQTVDDKRCSPAGIRSALRAIAAQQIAANRHAAAIAAYRELLTRPSVGERERLADLAALTALDPSAVGEFDKFIKAHGAAPGDHLASAYYYEAQVYLRLKQADKAEAAFDAALALRRVPFTQVRLALLGKAEARLLKNDRAGAVAVYRNLLQRPNKQVPSPAGFRAGDTTYADHDRLADLDRMIAVAPGTDVTGDLASCLSHVWEVGEVSLSDYAPKNDVLYPIQAGRTTPAMDRKAPSDKFPGTERYRQYLLETTGQAPQDKLDAVERATGLRRGLAALRGLELLQRGGQADFGQCAPGRIPEAPLERRVSSGGPGRLATARLARQRARSRQLAERGGPGGGLRRPVLRRPARRPS